MEEHGARAMNEASQSGTEIQPGTAEMTRFCMRICRLREFWIDHHIAKTLTFYHLAIFLYLFVVAF